MAYGIGLGRFAFAVVRRAVNFVGCLATQTVARVPEIGRARLIRDIAQHGADFAFVDFPKRLAAELKIVTLLIDRPTAVTINQNALLHFGNQFLQRNALLRRFERDIGHARKGHAAPTVGVQAAIRFLVADQWRQIARGLPIHEDSILYQIPALGRHALIVIGHRSQTLWLRAVGEEVAAFGAE